MTRPILREHERTQRNLNPTKPAVAAMWLYGAEYARQGGGSMDFWDGLHESRKRTCRALVDAVEKAIEEPAR